MPPLNVTPALEPPTMVRAPEMLTRPEKLIELLTLALFTVRLLFPVTPPGRAAIATFVAIVRVPLVVPNAMALGKVTGFWPMVSVALALPELAPIVTRPVPSGALLFAVAVLTLPERMVTPPAKLVLVAVKVNAEVALFSVISPTVLPTTPLRVAVPVPVPELVMAPVFPMAPAPMVREAVPLSVTVMLPVPEMAPELTIVPVPVSANVTLLFKVMLPLKVALLPPPLFPIVNVPLLPACTVLGLATVKLLAR